MGDGGGQRDRAAAADEEGDGLLLVLDLGLVVVVSGWTGSVVWPPHTHIHTIRRVCSFTQSPYKQAHAHLQEPDNIRRDRQVGENAVRPLVVDSEGGGGDGENTAGLWGFCM